MDYVLTHCTLLDGSPEMEPQENRSVLVRNGRIEEISSGRMYRGIGEIDLGGRFLLPGLIDLHVHLAGSGKPVKMPSVSGGREEENDGSGRTSEEAHQESDADGNGGDKNRSGRKADRSDAVRRKVFESMEHGFIHKGLVKNVRNNVQTKLYSGVTTVRSVGEMYWSDLENRDLINAGAYIGPRLLVSGVGVSVPGGHMAGTMAKPCRTKEECVAQVNLAAQKGVDWIKIFVTGGVLDASDSGEPARVRMPLGLARAACSRAHELGYKVAVHAESAEGVRISLEAGVDSVEHGARMTEEILTLYKANQASVTVTISPAIAIARLPESLTGMNQAQREAAEYVMNGIIESGIQARVHGIPVGLGTDASCPYVTQYDMWREIWYYAHFCEVSPAQALSTATLGNARILGLEEETGFVSEGKSADLIVIRENPLQDLKALRRVDTVIMKGEVIANPKFKRIPKIDRALDEIMK